jgi:TM2 domain-containing membrane protein YozV
MFTHIMDAADSLDVTPGVKSCSLAYALLILGGFFGLHQFYLRRPFTALVYATTGGLMMGGVIFDFFTLPIQVYMVNRR